MYSQTRKQQLLRDEITKIVQRSRPSSSYLNDIYELLEKHRIPSYLRAQFYKHAQDVEDKIIQLKQVQMKKTAKKPAKKTTKKTTAERSKTLPGTVAVIDATTGTVLSPDNLHVVMASEEQLDAACDCDSAAHALAMSHGRLLSLKLLIAVARMPDPVAVRLLATAMTWQVEKADGQLVLYTGVKA